VLICLCLSAFLKKDGWSYRHQPW